MIYVFLAEGFEEVEAMTPVDCLRRAGKTVKTVGVGGAVITGSHGIPVTADLPAKDVRLDEELEMIVLPGGMPGTLNLEKDETVGRAIDYCIEQNKWIAAICAAPTILGRRGLLQGKKATCFPGMEGDLKGADFRLDSVCQDGNLITARGAGTAMDFGLKLVEILITKEKSEQLAAKMVYRK